MIRCPVCEHEHRGMIEVLLESPHPLSRISMFYEVPEHDLRRHQVVCMNHLGGLDE